MKAIACTKYGPPEVLQLIEKDIPIPKKNEVLINIKATAVTASDCIIRSFNMPGDFKFPRKQFMEYMMKAVIGFSKPRKSVIGLVFSGEIISIGNNVKRFKEGDNVYGFTGLGFGTYAEYKTMSEKESSRTGCIDIKPANSSHNESVAVVYGGILSIHFMRKWKIQSGNQILVYGASGAIGTIAMQIAKSYGAVITAVCSASNFELVKSLGADKVIDYTKEDAVQELETYDFVFDAVGNNKSSELKEKSKKVLNNNGKYASVDESGLQLHSKYLDKIRELIEQGKIKPVIDKEYPLEQIADAHRYVDKGHKKGCVVITMD